MDTIFSSEDVHQRDRFTYWHDVACREIVKHDARAHNENQFHARLSVAHIDTVSVTQFDVAPMLVERNERHAAKTEHDDYMLTILGEGAAQFFGVRDVGLSKGQATLLDPTLPYSGRFLSDCEMTIARIPRRELETRVGSIAPLILAKLDSSSFELSSIGKLLQASLEGPTASEKGSVVIRDTIVDLLSLALGQQLRGVPRASNTRERKLNAIHQVVRRNIADPDFTVEQAAALAGVSVRYANALLQPERLRSGD